MSYFGKSAVFPKLFKKDIIEIMVLVSAPCDSGNHLHACTHVTTPILHYCDIKQVNFFFAVTFLKLWEVS